MIKKPFIVLFVILSACFYSQDSSLTFYPKAGKLFADIGFMYNHPGSEPSKSDYIRQTFLPDFTVDIGCLFSNPNHHGWMILAGLSTRNHNFNIKTKYGSTGSTSVEFGSLYYYAGIKKTFDFNLSEKINLLIAAGPVLIFNPLSSSDNFYTQQEMEVEDVNTIGAAANFAAHLVRKIKNERYLFLKASYQYGFINFTEVKVTNPSYGASRLFYYNGTGPAIKAGFIF